MRLPTRTSWTLISASSLFTMATLLVFGAGPALLALGWDRCSRTSAPSARPFKLCFNIAQHVLSVVLAWLVFRALGGDGGALEAAEIPAAVAAAATFLLSNSLLTGSVVAWRPATPSACSSRRTSTPG